MAEGNTDRTAMVRHWPGFAVSKHPGTHVRPFKAPVRPPSGPPLMAGGRGKDESAIR